MNFKITKGVLLSSLLFTGAISWNGYSEQKYNWVQDDGKVTNLDYNEIKVYINNLKNNIKSNYEECNKLLKEVKADQFLEILQSINEGIEKLIFTDEKIDADRLADLENQQDSMLSEFIVNSFDSIKQKNEKAADELYQDFLKHIYRIKLTALAIISNKLNVNGGSVLNDKLRIPKDNKLNAKKLLEDLTNDPKIAPLLNNLESAPLKVKDFWEQIDTEAFKNMTNTLFEQVADERIKEISEKSKKSDEYNKETENKILKIKLNEKTKKMYKDLNKIIQYCSNLKGEK